MSLDTAVYRFETSQRSVLYCADLWENPEKLLDQVGLTKNNRPGHRRQLKGEGRETALPEKN